MPRPAITLYSADNGGFIARKRIPADVQDAYKRLYGHERTEERFHADPMPAGLARAKWREWVSAIEARIANIRAERNGEGRTLTPKEARALAAEWYSWFAAKMAANNWPAAVWEDYRGRMWTGLDAAATAGGMLSGDPLDHWERDSGMREHVRPIIADEAKSAQFLAAKRLTLDPAAMAMFLDYVVRDFFAAVGLLARQAQGDFGPDEYAARFPQSAGAADTSLSPWSLFERWITEAKPATSTVDRWRAVFLKLQTDFPNHSAASLLSEQMQQWAKGLINEGRSPRTVRDVWVIAARTVFAWAIGQRLLTRNPFVGWRITVPKTNTTRETKAFTDDEISTVLSAAAAMVVRSKTDAAKRWAPWLAAYSGARMGEITQLRGVDVTGKDGAWAIKISPEAGTTKTGKTRVVPLHEHLIEQGFVEFVKASGKGPLFYTAAAGPAAPDDPTNPRKPRYVKAREYVAAWVREIGVDDPELQPNHAWRHTFKAVGHRCGISEKLLDAIVGHAPASVGRGYGEPTLADKAKALEQFPRYKCAG
jgi:integrase